ncbi:MAG: hypothetical protein Q9219_006803 [cf. Caloplaca sp. 3 TL-2023]
MKFITSTRGFDPNQPLTFSRDLTLNPDIKLPKTWIARRSLCIIGVDIPEAVGGMEKTSLEDIKSAAHAIAVDCVIQPPHLGGILQIGWQTKLNVVVVHDDEAKLLHAVGRNRSLGIMETA